MAANLLLFVTRDLIQICQVHEFRDGLVEENEVSHVVTVRVQVLLIHVPVNGISGDAGRPW